MRVFVITFISLLSILSLFIYFDYFQSKTNCFSDLFEMDFDELEVMLSAGEGTMVLAAQKRTITNQELIKQFKEIIRGPFHSLKIVKINGLTPICGITLKRKDKKSQCGSITIYHCQGQLYLTFLETDSKKDFVGERRGYYYFAPLKEIFLRILETEFKPNLNSPKWEKENYFNRLEKIRNSI